ncbi:MAG: cobyric acid synthase, partial [Muribaculaceae bacterium]|nr:cobyric acid synthase [Muribaculaceae bacterium]
RCFGSYVHGLLDNAPVIDFLLQPFRHDRMKTEFDFSTFRQQQYDLLADWLREYIDIPRLYKIMMCDD